ncbi:hypothetical protein [Candidatus Chloroploca asiatica]|uniref:hypothetical protein n=1 Tax=Candidatus Chloroploca asiatica TaxID=1506545 RepID=UPI001141330C|nr:hypothetical protein [Candidatus Chloroploca asiatica]
MTRDQRRSSHTKGTGQSTIITPEENTSSRNEKQAQPSLGIVIDTLQKLAGLTTAIAGLAYVIGFIILTIHLAKFGVYGASLLNSRYISVGVLYILLLSFPLLYAARYFHYRSVIAVTISVFILPVFSFAALAVLGFINTTSLDQLVSSFALWIFTAALFPTIELMKEVYGTRLNPITMEPARPPWLKYLSPLPILGTIVGIFVYANAIYPNISPRIGGGEPVKIFLVAKRDKLEAISQLVRLDKELVTAPLYLIEQNQSSYVVLAQDIQSDEIRAVSIQSDLVDGIIYPNLPQNNQSNATVMPTLPVTQTNVPSATVSPTISP